MTWFQTDPHALYVTVSYAATAAILAYLVWSTVRANARARATLEGVDRPRTDQGSKP